MADEQEITVVEVISESDIAVILASEPDPITAVVVTEDAPINVVVSEVVGIGGGDMYASVYDTDGDGKVNSAELADEVPWSGVTDPPSTYTPSAHTHIKSEVGLGNCDNTADTAKPVSVAQQTALDGKISHSLATAINDFLVASGVGVFVKKTLAEVKTILGLGSAAYTESSAYQPALGYTAENAANKGAASGYCPLDSSTKVAATYLPSYVDDVEEYANLAGFPGTGETGKIYVALDTNKTYRWTGSTYVEISPSPGSTDAVTEGATNLYFTNVRASAAAPVQSVAGKTGTVTLAKGDVGLGNVDNTADASKPVSTAQQTALDGKISHSLATAANDFLVASGVGVFVKKTLDEVKTVLGLGTAAYTASTAYEPALGNPAASGQVLASTTGGARSWVSPGGDMFTTLLNAEVSVTGATSLSASAAGRMHVCSGTSADYTVILPSVAAKSIVAFRMDPALTKWVTLATGADVVAKTGTVTGGTSINAAGTGTVSTTGSSTTLAGSGTAFTTELRVGDTINCVGLTRRVVAIASDTSLTMDTAATISSTAFVYTQTGLLGSGTQLSTDYTVGNGITIDGVTRRVTYVLSATVIAIDRPFTVAPSGSAHGLTTATIDGKYNRPMWANETAVLLYDGSNWTKISGKSIPLRFSYFQSSSVTSFTNGQYGKVTCDTALDSLNDMTVVSSSTLTAPRSNNWNIYGNIEAYSSAGGNMTRAIGRLYKNGTYHRITADKSETVAQGTPSNIGISSTLHLSQTDAVDVYLYIATASGTTNIGGYQGGATGASTWIEGVEQILW